MKQRSLFGPLVLIAIGVIWLLIAMKMIPAANLWALAQLAPYALMAFGLGLILQSRWPVAGQVISTLVVFGAIAAVFFAGQLGWDKPVFWQFNNGFGGGETGSGIVTTETRQVDEFDSIDLKYPAEVIIQQGNSASVEIEAEDNLVPQISTDVRSGALVIDNQEEDWSARVSPTKPVRITIIVTNLSEINFSSAGSLDVQELDTDSLKLVLSGAGDARITDLLAEELEVILSGAGSIDAEGTAGELKLTISGLGSFNGGDLETNEARVSITGAGDATVRVAKELKATITGAGSVEYFGSPEVEKNITGAGSVKPVE